LNGLSPPSCRPRRSPGDRKNREHSRHAPGKSMSPRVTARMFPGDAEQSGEGRALPDQSFSVSRFRRGNE
jgi:hypothetical protein